jgi:meso-butanediol dehydrogenase / (S,S)-butanediol dehydrogenase / diacetyl reductase
VAEPGSSGDAGAAAGRGGSGPAGAGKLDGKIALITGAGSGIGRATAELFAAEGAAVVVVDIRQARVEETVEALRAGGHAAVGFRADVSREDEVAAMVAAATDAFGGLDVLFNNAGTAKPGTALELSLEDWRRVLDVNLTSVFLGVKHAVPAIAARGGGSVINTASISGLRGDEANFAYNAAKAGVVNVTRALAIDFAPLGVRVNCICPGGIDTPPMAWVFPDAASRARAEQAHVLGRLGRPAEIAAAALFLACADSSFVTGHALVVDGGATIGTGLPSLGTPPTAARP